MANNDSKIKRKLTSILSADAVGYSRLMSENEEQTLQTLAGHRRVIDAIIEDHEGRIVNTAGDSVLAEFPSSVDAVRCAIEMQDALKTRNDALPEERRMLFRVGINLGDVVISGTDLLGDGINVAARLQSIAEAGGICISSSVFDQIAGKINLGFVDLGEQGLKNITRPIHVYKLSGGSMPLRPEARPPQRRVGHPRVVIAAGVITVAAAFALAWLAGWLAPSPPVEEKKAASPIERRPPAPQSDQEKLRLEAERDAAQAKLGKARGARELEQLQTEIELQKASGKAEVRRQAAKPPAVALPVQPTPAEVPPAHKPPIPNAPKPTISAEAKLPQWVGTMSCDPFEDRPPIRFRLPLLERNGELTLERGKAGEPGYIFLQGKPEGGQLAMIGNVVSGTSATLGRQRSARLAGNFDGKGYQLTGRLGRRPCSLVIEGAR